MFIFVVMFTSCLVYLFNLVLLKIEAVAANESDSGTGAVTVISQQVFKSINVVYDVGLLYLPALLIMSW